MWDGRCTLASPPATSLHLVINVPKVAAVDIGCLGPAGCNAEDKVAPALKQALDGAHAEPVVRRVAHAVPEVTTCGGRAIRLHTQAGWGGAAEDRGRGGEVGEGGRYQGGGVLRQALPPQSQARTTRPRVAGLSPWRSSSL